MPRIAAKKKEYKVLDLKKWVKMQIAANGLNQTKVGEALGISQVALSQRLKKQCCRRQGYESRSFFLRRHCYPV